MCPGAGQTLHTAGNRATAGVIRLGRVALLPRLVRDPGQHVLAIEEVIGATGRAGSVVAGAAAEDVDLAAVRGLGRAERVGRGVPEPVVAVVAAEQVVAGLAEYQVILSKATRMCGWTANGA